MEQCSVYCINTEKDAVADILERTEKRLKVVLSGTDMTLILTRHDTRYAYVGFMGGLEFETFGILEE